MTELSARFNEMEIAEQIMTMWKNQNSPVKKLSPGGSTHTSVRSTSSAARLRDLRAREELAHLELQRIEAAANLARIRLEKQRLKERTEDLEKEPLDEISRVQNSFLTSHLEETLMFSNVETEDQLDDLAKELENEISQVQNSFPTSHMEETLMFPNVKIEDKLDNLAKDLADGTSQDQSCVQRSHMEETELILPIVESEDNVDDLDKELAAGTSKVQNCIQTSPLRLNDAEEIHLQKNEERQGDLGKELAGVTSQVQNCTQTSLLRLNDAEEIHLQKDEEAIKTEQPILFLIQDPTQQTGKETVEHSPLVQHQPVHLGPDLPDYKGNSSALNVFEVVYENTSKIDILKHNKSVHREVPYYDVNNLEWKATKVVNKCRDDTLMIYRPMQNKLRLRQAIVEARHTFRSLPHYDATPDEVTYEVRPPRLQRVAKIQAYVMLLYYGCAVERATKKKEQLDLDATYTASEEDEGGGLLHRNTAEVLVPSPFPEVGATHKGETVGD